MGTGVWGETYCETPQRRSYNIAPSCIPILQLKTFLKTTYRQHNACILSIPHQFHIKEDHWYGSSDATTSSFGGDDGGVVGRASMSHVRDFFFGATPQECSATEPLVC